MSQKCGVKFHLVDFLRTLEEFMLNSDKVERKFLLSWAELSAKLWKISARRNFTLNFGRMKLSPVWEILIKRKSWFVKWLRSNSKTQAYAFEHDWSQIKKTFNDVYCWLLPVLLERKTRNSCHRIVLSFHMKNSWCTAYVLQQRQQYCICIASIFQTSSSHKKWIRLFDDSG